MGAMRRRARSNRWREPSWAESSVLFRQFVARGTQRIAPCFVACESTGPDTEADTLAPTCRRPVMPSFDAVCKPNMVEVRNAIDQANKEIANRFDFKGSDARFEQKDFALTAYADDEFNVGRRR